MKRTYHDSSGLLMSAALAATVKIYGDSAICDQEPGGDGAKAHLSSASMGDEIGI